MFCTNCGHEFEGKFCSACGTPSAGGAPAAPGAEKPSAAKAFMHSLAESAKSEGTKRRERIEENKRNGVACCPKCGSTSISAAKKGFGFGKAAVGAVATGGIGLLAGGIGANKTMVTCLNCGHKWKL